jgi:hypothetical protein
MIELLICRGCGARLGVELAIHQKELADVGMLEQSCARCQTTTRWGLAADYRRRDRRSTERRARDERRHEIALAPLVGRERRAGRDRRLGPIRRAERRMRAY